MATIKFFHQVAPIRTRISMKAPRRDKKEKGLIPITFRMGLNSNNVRSGPDFVKRAYEEVVGEFANQVSLPKVVEGVTVQIFDTADSPSQNFALESVLLESLSVLETKNSEGDKAVVLTFETVYPYDSEVWAKMGRFFKTDVFLVFDAAQASLLDALEPESDDEEEPELLSQEEEDEDPRTAGKKKGRAKKDGKAAAAGDGPIQ